MRRNRRDDPLMRALAACRPGLYWAAAFSAVVNILYLTPTIYMMQVYDRVVPAASGGTLLFVSLACLAGLATLSALDWLRGRLLVRVSARLERLVAGLTLDAALSRRDLGRLDRAEAIREFDTLRQTIAGGAMLAIFDAPWAPIYLVVAFLLHPFLGLTTLVATAILLALAWANERATHAPIAAANDSANEAYARQAQVTAYAEEVRALGMREALVAKSLHEREEANARQLEASFAAGRYGALIKFVRLVFQSLALAVGAWLAISGRISMGSIIAASLLLTRTLSPIEQIVGTWKGLVRAREAGRRISHLLSGRPVLPDTALPAPAGRIDVEGLTVRANGSDRAILNAVTLGIAPGQSIGLVGLSGAGKSTLLRALSGALVPAEGTIRFDGAALADWAPETLARAIGYLPQDFVLFPGTVKDNISRFSCWRGLAQETVDAATIAAAEAVGAHEMILRLPNGYDTRVGQGGIGLSAGQTQRVALARALYGEPRIILLDEPNAHLDAEASAALFETLARYKRDGATIVIAAHNTTILGGCDRFVIVANGRIAERTAADMRKPVAVAKGA